MARRPALLFDFGGTLDADGAPWSAQFHRAFLLEGIAVERDRFAALFRRSDAILSDRPGIMRSGYREMIALQTDILLELLGREDRTARTRIADRVVSAATAIASRNRPLLEALQSSWRPGIVSNFTGNLAHCLAELGLAPLFDVVADSGVLGFAKPDRKIFLWALSTLEAEPEGSWMVGDNFDADIRPAAKLGLFTCWIAPPERPWPGKGSGLYRIAALTELGLPLEGTCRA